MIVRILFALLLFVGTAGTAHAELRLVGEAKRDAFVRVESDSAGKWLILGPNKLWASPATSISGATVTIGGPTLARADMLVLDDGKACVFVGAPGVYAVIQITPDTEEPELLPVEITGSDPIPPGPGPNPGPDPPIVTTGQKLILIWYETESSSQKFNDTMTTLRSSQIAVDLSAKKHQLLILDDDNQPANPGAATKIAVEAAIKTGSPSITIVDVATSRVVSSAVLPVDAGVEVITSAIKAAGG